MDQPANTQLRRRDGVLVTVARQNFCGSHLVQPCRYAPADNTPLSKFGPSIKSTCSKAWPCILSPLPPTGLRERESTASFARLGAALHELVEEPMVESATQRDANSLQLNGTEARAWTMALAAHSGSSLRQVLSTRISVAD